MSSSDPSDGRFWSRRTLGLKARPASKTGTGAAVMGSLKARIKDEDKVGQGQGRVWPTTIRARNYPRCSSLMLGSASRTSRG